MNNQNLNPQPDTDQFVMPIEFLDEPANLLIEYEIDEEDGPIISSVRLCVEVAKFGEVFYRPNGTHFRGPAYEATWLYGPPGINDLLSPRQIGTILKYMYKNKSLLIIPEDRIIYAQPYYDEKKQMNLYRVVFKDTHDVFVTATDPTRAFIKADSALEVKGYALKARTLKFIELIASEDDDNGNAMLCL